MTAMLDMRDLCAMDLQTLPPQAAALIEQMRQQIEQQAQLLQRKEKEIAWRDAKLEKVNFELARLKRWKYGARTEAMSAEQRQLFQETLFEDEASLQAQLAALQVGVAETTPAAPKAPPRRPRRQALPEHLRRVEHRHEPEDTTCATPGCGQPMARIGEDVSERLDIVPAEFFVHRHIYGKWACRCCQSLVQEPTVAEIVEGGIPTSGLLAHTLVSRFVDHLPYYRQEAINARSGVHTPRATLAAWAGQAGAALEPLYDEHKRFVLGCQVLHADETPVALLDPGSGKTRKAYVWAYARGELDPLRGVIFEFCLGRGAQYPSAFLAGQATPWSGTLLTDQYAGYGPVLDRRVYPRRRSAGCVVHARRKFDELARSGTSTLAREALDRFGWIYHVEGQFAGMTPAQRRQARDTLTKPRWDELRAWLELERRRVPDGGPTAAAIDYSLGNWESLTLHLQDGSLPLDNNFLERQIKPWQLGRKNWLFAGSELAGQRAAVVMSLVQSAKLNGHDPWAYLRDVLSRLPTQLNSRIDELLPHRWQAR